MQCSIQGDPGLGWAVEHQGSGHGQTDAPGKPSTPSCRQGVAHNFSSRVATVLKQHLYLAPADAST